MERNCSVLSDTMIFTTQLPNGAQMEFQMTMYYTNVTLLIDLVNMVETYGGALKTAIILRNWNTLPLGDKFAFLFFLHSLSISFTFFPSLLTLSTTRVSLEIEVATTNSALDISSSWYSDEHLKSLRLLNLPEDVLLSVSPFVRIVNETDSVMKSVEMRSTHGSIVASVLEATLYLTFPNLGSATEVIYDPVIQAVPHKNLNGDIILIIVAFAVGTCILVTLLTIVCVVRKKYPQLSKSMALPEPEQKQKTKEEKVIGMGGPTDEAKINLIEEGSNKSEEEIPSEEEPEFILKQETEEQLIEEENVDEK
jgi:hypothetical protein